MNDEVDPAPGPAIEVGDIDGAPEPGPLNTLALRLTPGAGAAAGSLVLRGAFHLGSEIIGHYSAPMPAPVVAVAVHRASGRVHMQLLINEGDLPPVYRRQGRPAGGVGELGQFQVDLASHLSLPDAAGTYDVFTWLHAVQSPVVAVEKAARGGTSPGATQHGLPAAVAALRPAALAKPLGLSAARLAGHRQQVFGHVPQGPAAVVAQARESGRLAWVALGPEQPGPFDFQIDIEGLLPGLGAQETVYAQVLARGQRSALLRLQPEG